MLREPYPIRRAPRSSRSQSRMPKEPHDHQMPSVREIVHTVNGATAELLWEFARKADPFRFCVPECNRMTVRQPHTQVRAAGNRHRFPLFGDCPRPLKPVDPLQPFFPRSGVEQRDISGMAEQYLSVPAGCYLARRALRELFARPHGTTPIRLSRARRCRVLWSVEPFFSNPTTRTSAPTYRRAMPSDRRQGRERSCRRERRRLPIARDARRFP